MPLSESQEQAALLKWTQQPSIRKKWPELALLFHIANERKDAREVAQLRRLGVKSGVPDLFLPVPRGKYHGLWIEMKTKSGVISTHQHWWIENLKDQGYAAGVARGWEQAAAIIGRYMENEEVFLQTVHGGNARSRKGKESGVSDDKRNEQADL